MGAHMFEVSLLGVGTALRLERVALSNYITTKGKQLEGAFFLGRALKLRRFDKEGGGRQRGLSSRCSSRRFFLFWKDWWCSVRRDVACRKSSAGLGRGGGRLRCDY